MMYIVVQRNKRNGVVDSRLNDKVASRLSDIVVPRGRGAQ